MDKSLRHKSGGVLALIMLAPFVLIRELPAQTFTPRSSAAYHEFDFWVGNWDVFETDSRKDVHTLASTRSSTAAFCARTISSSTDTRARASASMMLLAIPGTRVG